MCLPDMLWESCSRLIQKNPGYVSFDLPPFVIAFLGLLPYGPHGNVCSSVLMHLETETHPQHPYRGLELDPCEFQSQSLLMVSR